MLHVESAIYKNDYKIVVTFNDGSSHLVDFENTISNDSRAIVSALKDLTVFKDFSIQHHTLAWANGLDFAPEFIKDCSIKLLGESA
ncbi:MAG: DUF2442 domain-containing protein [Treponema sp.]|nr:DUF2442 domain-containing protein [Treponema sp.]